MISACISTSKTQGLVNFSTNTFTKLFKTSFWSPNWHLWHVNVDAHLLMHLWHLGMGQENSFVMAQKNMMWTNYTMISHQAIITSYRRYKLFVYGVLSSKSYLFIFTLIKKIMTHNMTECVLTWMNSRWRAWIHIVQHCLFWPEESATDAEWCVFVL